MCFMDMRKAINILFLFSLLLGSCKAPNNMIDKTVIKQLDIERYMGTWYEIARYDHKFEHGLVGVTATYSFRKDGKIRVVNRGYKGGFSGPVSEAIGKAKVPDKNEPGKLKVSFFWIFYGDYFVLDLDKNYQWALIGSRSDKYLWILSRTPAISNNLKQQLLQKLSKRGYDTSKLIMVEQQQ